VGVDVSKATKGITKTAMIHTPFCLLPTGGYFVISKQNSVSHHSVEEVNMKVPT
jgi:hypothetical protein